MNEEVPQSGVSSFFVYTMSQVQICACTRICIWRMYIIELLSEMVYKVYKSSRSQPARLWRETVCEGEVVWRIQKKNRCEVHCAGHSDEPLRTKIVSAKASTIFESHLHCTISAFTPILFLNSPSRLWAQTWRLLNIKIQETIERQFPGIWERVFILRVGQVSLRVMIQ